MQRYECAKCGDADFWLYGEPGIGHGVCQGCGYPVILNAAEIKRKKQLDAAAEDEAQRLLDLQGDLGRNRRSPEVEAEIKLAARKRKLADDLAKIDGLSPWQRAARARWAGLTPEQRREHMRPAFEKRHAQQAAAAASAKPKLKPRGDRGHALKRLDVEAKRVSGYRLWWDAKTDEERREHMRAAWEAWRAKSHRAQGVSPPVHAGVAQPQAGA